MNIVFWIMILLVGVIFYYVLLFIMDKTTNLIKNNKEEKENKENGQENEHNKE